MNRDNLGWGNMNQGDLGWGAESNSGNQMLKDFDEAKVGYKDPGIAEPKEAIHITPKQAAIDAVTLTASYLLDKYTGISNT